MWANEEAREVAAPPEAVWRLFSDPSTWVDWHPDIRSARIEGEMAVGSTVHVKQRGAPARRLSVIAVEPGRSYSTEDRMPGARMRFHHEVMPAGGGSRVLLRQTIEGPLAPVYARLLGRRIARGVRPQLDGMERAFTGSEGPG